MTRSLYRKATPDELARAARIRERIGSLEAPPDIDVPVRVRATAKLVPMPKAHREKPAPEPAAEPKRRGRPATGRQPNAVYTAKAKRQLEEAGGHRMTVNLSPDAVQAIADIQNIEGFARASECINVALASYASILRRRAAIKAGRKP